MRYWAVKRFQSQATMDKWIEANKAKCQIDVLFINNSFGVSYKKLLVLK